MNIAHVQITPSAGLDASTFGSGSFVIVHDGTTDMASLTLRLDTAILSGLVFDPLGLAGDTVGKDFTLDGETGDGVGVSHSFLDGSDEAGWSAMELVFADFEPGESLSFSVDVDPASTKGTAAPGPAESASVSGLELMGSAVEVAFGGGASADVELFALAGSVSGSAAEIGPAASGAPTLSVIGQGQVPATVSQPTQQIEVSGQPGAVFRLVLVEGGRFTSDAVDPAAPTLGSFEANTALSVAEYEGTIGADGTAIVDVTLSRSDPALDSGEEGVPGVNIITAAFIDADGKSGDVAQPLVLELEAAAPSGPASTSASPSRMRAATATARR